MLAAFSSGPHAVNEIVPEFRHGQGVPPFHRPECSSDRESIQGGPLTVQYDGDQVFVVLDPESSRPICALRGRPKGDPPQDVVTRDHRRLSEGLIGKEQDVDERGGRLQS